MFAFQFYKVRLKPPRSPWPARRATISILQSSIKASKSHREDVVDAISILQSSIKARSGIFEHVADEISILQSSIKAHPGIKPPPVP